ncbi:MAG: inorganic diphosphatase [Clostridia bacterium]|nr:inorganic diphosphatase [Clostridia bacterium]
MLQKALALSYLGKELEIKIDRPLGSTHPKHKNIVYPVNYGYIPNQIVGDGEELDVYLLGVNEPVSEYKAKIIAVIYRLNDNEDKLVACPSGISFTKEQIIEMVHFQEQYFQIEIEKIS